MVNDLQMPKIKKVKKEPKISNSDNNQEIEQLKLQLVRALADYDNLQKRVEKQSQEIYEQTLVMITKKFLPFFDMLTNAQKYTKDSGLAIALGEFENILKEEGVVKITAKQGEEFDQSVHEAVDTRGSDPKGLIAEMVSEGWKMQNGQVIRYAKVVVE